MKLQVKINGFDRDDESSVLLSLLGTTWFVMQFILRSSPRTRRSIVILLPEQSTLEAEV